MAESERMTELTVLVVGGGGREHALAWKISQSPRCKKLYMAPGNPMCSGFAECVDILAHDIVALKSFARERGIDLTVVGPEAPLVAGITDAFEAVGLKVFGPSKAAARLEGSKGFSKELMRKYKIPTAAFERARTRDQAVAILKRRDPPIVIKADGLAEGKGVFVCRDYAEIDAALHAIYAEKRFGASGESCVIEDFMEGEEASLFVLTDGHAIMPLVVAQDHKPLLDGDRGPNTGGMGSYAPAPVLQGDKLDWVLKEIVVPTIHAMNHEGCPYRGLLYVGLMVQRRGAMVVEYNCRFGDPETQALMMLMKSDILPLLLQVAEGKLLIDQELEWHEGSSIGVVMASEGYPGAYPKGLPIAGLDELPDGVMAFAAGVKGSKTHPLTSGGRVLCVTARGEDLDSARDRVYAGIAKIHFEGAQFRRDIGHHALKI